MQFWDPENLENQDCLVKWQVDKTCMSINMQSQQAKPHSTVDIPDLDFISKIKFQDIKCGICCDLLRLHVKLFLTWQIDLAQHSRPVYLSCHKQKEWHTHDVLSEIYLSSKMPILSIGGIHKPCRQMWGRGCLLYYIILCSKKYPKNCLHGVWRPLKVYCSHYVPILICNVTLML